jgi:hypothetical protein
MLWLVASAMMARAEDLHLESIGTRFGIFHDGANAHFYQAEVFVNMDLPLSWSLGADWWLQSRIDAAVGWLGKSGVNAAIGSLGPSLLAGKSGSPLSFELGFSPTLLSRYDFPGKDLGSSLQFTSHAGMNVDLSSRIRLGYRFEHMSNGGLITPNPGLNLNIFAVSYLF